MSTIPSSINLNSQTVASKCNQWNYQPVNKIPMEMINMIPKSLMLGLSNLPKLMEMLEYYNLWSMTPCKMEPSDTNLILLNKFNCYMNKKMKTHWWLDMQWCGMLASLVFFSSPFLFYFFFSFLFFKIDIPSEIALRRHQLNILTSYSLVFTNKKRQHLKMLLELQQ